MAKKQKASKRRGKTEIRNILIYSCPKCGGRESCPYCHGRECESCGYTGKCPHCYRYYGEGVA